MEIYLSGRECSHFLVSTIQSSSSWAEISLQCNATFVFVHAEGMFYLKLYSWLL